MMWVADNSHQVVRRRCGGVADIDCATGSAPLEASNTVGFILDEAKVTCWWICFARQLNTTQRPSRTAAQRRRRIMTEHDGSTTSNGALQPRTCTRAEPATPKAMVPSACLR